MDKKIILRSASDVREHFSRNRIPYYFVSATNFNLMWIHDWVSDWRSITLIDCFDGKHPQVAAIQCGDHQVFESIEEVNTYLLLSHEAQSLFARDGAKSANGRVMFLFLNEEIEAICRASKLDVILPPNRLVREIDSKIVTTEIGNSVGVSSVPNVLTRISSYADLCRTALNAGLGDRWVVQTPYGDSGKTTFFIACEADYRNVADKIETEERVKVMKWINCVGAAMEACATRWGTFVGPLLTELIGANSLTPYPGGWCGNELYDAAFPIAVRQDAQRKTKAIGDALYQRGYRGTFELDYLIDRETGNVYLGELNSRITGITAMSNMSKFSTQQVPIFLLHLLEFDPHVDLCIDPENFNNKLLWEGATGVSSQVILKYTDEPLKIVTAAPVSGVYRLSSDGKLTIKHAGYRRPAASEENEAYILRIMDVGEYAYKGGDLAIMFLNQVIGDKQASLNSVGEAWVGALKECFEFRHLNQVERSTVEAIRNPTGIKSSQES